MRRAGRVEQADGDGKDKTSEWELQDHGKAHWGRFQMTCALCTGFSPELAQVGKGQWDMAQAMGGAVNLSPEVHLPSKAEGKNGDILRRKEGI